MINEQMTLYTQTLEARIKVLEEKVARLEGNATKGTSGSMTVTEPHSDVEGYVTPNTTYGANIREWPSTADDNPPLYRLKYGHSLRVDGHADDIEDKINPATGKPFVWYMVMDGDDNFVREDVVTFTTEKPQPTPRPSNFVFWPAPVRGFTITNHDGHAHDGLDFACPFGTPIQAGPNGGYVVKAFTCAICNPREGDGKASLQDPGKAFGYGSHVIVRYDYDAVPQAIRDTIPNGAYVYCIYAHLSTLAVAQGQTLAPYQMIGEVGATGNTYSTVPGGSPSHLHLSLRWSTHPDSAWARMNNNRINPNLLFKVN